MSATLPYCVSQWGAPMGRIGNQSEPDFPVKFHLRKMHLNSGGYDSGGAYWGLPVWPRVPYMWHAWGDGEEEEQEVFLRAWTREEAKAAIREGFPRAKFYR